MNSENQKMNRSSASGKEEADPSSSLREKSADPSGTDEFITTDEILGRDALDPDGELIGSVIKLHLNRRTRELTGITVDQGFWKPDLFVGLQYVRKFGIDAVFLDRIPLQKYAGLRVFTSDGILAGSVAEVHGESEIEALVVKSRDPENPLKSRTETIQGREILEIGDSIILKRKSETR